MKKLISLLAALFLAANMIGCGADFPALKADYSVKDEDRALYATMDAALTGCTYTFQLFEDGKEAATPLTFASDGSTYYSLDWSWADSRQGGSSKIQLSLDGRKAEVTGGIWRLTLDFDAGTVTPERVYNADSFRSLATDTDEQYSVGTVNASPGSDYVLCDLAAASMTTLAQVPSLRSSDTVAFFAAGDYVFLLSEQSLETYSVASGTSTDFPREKPREGTVKYCGGDYDDATGSLALLILPEGGDVLSLLIYSADGTLLSTHPTDCPYPEGRPFSNAWPAFRADDGLATLTTPDGEVLLSLPYGEPPAEELEV